MIIAPSILSANFNNLIDEIKNVETAGADWLHCDIMDGHFVPNITFGPCVIKNISKYTNLVLDVHLMIEDPLKYAKEFSLVGADYITFHYEATNDVLNTINEIKKLGCKVGISIKPNTNVNVLNDYLDKVDLILIMSVEPGFGGQKFLDSSIDKIKYLANEKKIHNYNYLIEVDGGINEETSKVVKNAGVEVLVAGSYIFGSDNYQNKINNLKE